MTDEQRRARYQRICDQIDELIQVTSSPVAQRATAAAIIQGKVPGVSWTGFYLLHDGVLTVDAYQGPLACLVLAPHTGVCWAAIDRDETMLVNDVESFPGHIACDSQSRSELVVPMHDAEGRVFGVLDADSRKLDHFDEVDIEGCEAVVRLLERYHRS